ncbi:Phosphoglycerate dehydrogenase [Haladaptatus litoreus]|uniref:Phosphoglycerate dehydrogenase n=1 Tax=Haladaptatus litoreus TaxID=553468 RepID=A0A1N6ZGY6_9EURY|nr:D-2-hydroxyacid dehydrogenase [Haladaptatus litoreus]SIR26172.1 Phosphoglycerate dehydrogenase [Haladaptatus litoreus]
MSTPTLLLTHRLTPDIASDLHAELANHLPDGALARARTPEETFELLPEADGIVTAGLSEDLLDSATSLRWVQVLSAGVDQYDQDALEARDIALTNASGVHAEPIAEQVLWFLLTFERRLHVGVRQQSRGVWERFEGGELRGKTLGIIGVGAIGTRVAELGSGLGMTVLGTKRTVETAPTVLDDCFAADDHHEVLRRADYVVLACPLTDETEGLLGSEEFRLMPSDAVLVNIARGDVVDEDALIRALQYRLIRGAGLDVFSTEPLPSDSPLWNLSNAVLTPHMAGSTPHKAERWQDIIVENYEVLASDKVDEMVNRIV